MPVQHISSMSTMDGDEVVVDSYNRIANIAFTMKTVTKAADYTLLAEDSGKVFLTSTGAVTFTLPAVSNTGFTAYFINGVDANMTISSAAGNDIVFDGDAAVSSLAFSTASHKIGGAVMLVSNGTNWLAFVAGNGSAVATAS